MDSSTPPPLRKTFSVSIQAHRGFNAQYPENTLLSFEKAIEVKADYIELDVHTSSDNEVVVIHDASTIRVSSQILNVEKSTLGQIQSLKLKGDQKIPTLREVCKLCKGKIGINIEIKQKGITSQINDIIHEFGMEADVMISSFDHEELQIMHKLNPSLMISALEPNGGSMIKNILSIFHKGKFIDNALSIEAQGFNPHHRFITHSLCSHAHEKGLTVNPWTIDDPKMWDKLVAAGVDSIITNNPEALYEYFQERGANS
ncbi:MAG: glycerophosphodiester phosphodiesterase [Promethearchaeota archaeon]